MGWSDKVNQMAKSAVSKSREMAEITRLNMEISNNEQKIKDLASKLGMLAIEQNLLSDNDQAAELIAQIRRCQATIEQDKATVQEIRKADCSILTTLSGMEMLVREIHSRKALSPIVVIPSGIVTFARDSQKAKESIPIIVTPSGME